MAVGGSRGTNADGVAPPGAGDLHGCQHRRLLPGPFLQHVPGLIELLTRRPAGEVLAPGVIFHQGIALVALLLGQMLLLDRFQAILGLSLRTVQRESLDRAAAVARLEEEMGERRFLSPRAALALANAVADSHIDEGHEELSPREQRVYRLLGEGAGPSEIALALDISPHTVESYCNRILVKLGLNGMRELRHHARTHPPAPPA